MSEIAIIVVEISNVVIILFAGISAVFGESVQIGSRVTTIKDLPVIETKVLFMTIERIDMESLLVIAIEVSTVPGMSHREHDSCNK